MSPVYCVLLFRPCVGDILSIFHPEAFLVACMGSGEVTLQDNLFTRGVCC